MRQISQARLVGENVAQRIRIILGAALLAVLTASVVYGLGKLAA